MALLHCARLWQEKNSSKCMIISLCDNSISRKKSPKQIFISYTSVSADISLTIFSREIERTEHSVVYCCCSMAQCKESQGIKKKKDTRLSTILVSDQTKRREKMMIKMKLIRKLRRLLVH